MAPRILMLVVLALFAFAANSILARAALSATLIDPVSFTAIRIGAGAVFLAALVRLRPGPPGHGSWLSALALFCYALLFSLAYRSLGAATGALLLFAAVQITMLIGAMLRREPLSLRQAAGFVLAAAGLVALLSPGLDAPQPLAAALMLAAGAAWGVYSLRARGSGDPTRATAANFLLACLPAAGLLLFGGLFGSVSLDRNGTLLALASGALTSGLGYAIWYAALRSISTHTAAVVQLTVPVLTAVAGVVLLAELVSLRLLLAGGVILFGIALVAVPGRR